MNKTLLIGFGLLVWLLPGLWAQDNRIVDYAQKLSLAWSKDGVAIETGMGADGTQNLAVLAKGGYFPLTTRAKAGVPTVLRLYTNKTMDCGRAFLLPDLNKQAVLPVKGVTEFVLGPQKKGSTLFGSCGMGMYTFEIRFE